MNIINCDLIKAHSFALFSVIVWGGTFIATKILLNSLNPYQILLYRCIIAWCTLSLLQRTQPGRLDLRRETYYFFASLCGITLYFICENTALSLTYASNAALIVTVSPILSVLLGAIFFKERKISLMSLLGLLLSGFGVILVITNGKLNLHISPEGDTLAVMAAISWAFFPFFLKKISDHSTIEKVRHIFFHGSVTVIIFMFTFDIPLFNQRIFDTINILNILFLGIVASALCYLSWDKAVSGLGIKNSMIYMYFVPFVTVLLGYLFLHEEITFLMLLGGFLILFGVYVNNRQISLSPKR